jgi:hypothetical protein
VIITENPKDHRHIYPYVRLLFRLHLAQTSARQGLVDDVECVSECSVELRAFDFAEKAHRGFVEVFEGHVEHVVAVDHTGFW